MSNDFELDFDDDETGTDATETVETEQVADGDVQGTDVQGTDVQGTDVQGTDVQGTDVQGTDVQGTDVQAEDLTDTDTEGTPAVVATEAPASTDGQSEEDKAAEKAKAEAEAAEKAVENFKAVALGTLTHEDRDNATGELPVVLVQGVLDAYGEVPGAKYKAQAKAFLTDTMQDLMVQGAEDPSKFFEARTIMSLQKAIKDTKSTSTTQTVARPKVDPTEAHAERIAAMMLAPSLVAVPDDVDATWAEKAQALATSLEADVRAYTEWLSVKDAPLAEGATAPEQPKVSPVVLAAAKIAVGRAAGTTKRASTGTSTPRASTAGSGHRGDIGQHIKEAFDGVAVGDFLSIADIAKVESSQYGGDKPAPSQGAIAARLFPGGDKSKCNLDFVSPEGKEDGRERKGAVRTA